ncbi:GH92 family glycosyl hydrolase [Alistipes sp.]|uniref:GH92 family glycosyl hydrolase n=1 Tax=Alistipes sp. TaxID=1872444 RepID=UPI003AF6C751
MLKSRILLFVLSAASAACLSACRDQGVGRWVDPNIGGVAPLLTTVTPQVHRPHSMVRVFPVTEPGLNDRYFSDRIYGIALNMPRYRSGTAGSVMPTVGEVSFEPERSSSWYDHDLEELHPWSHRVWLEEPAVWAEWTTTERAALYEFDFTDAGRQANVLFRVGSEGEVAVEGNRVVSGWEAVDYARQYFYAVADRPFGSSGTYDGTALSGKRSASGSGIGAWFSAPAGVGKVCFRVGISYISAEQARANLEAETGGLAFDAVKERSRAVWEEALGRIRVEGGTERERRIFYTSLYRTFERMVDQSEGGRYYSGFDRRVHEDARPFYNDDWMWDTYRNLHALGMLLDPGRKADELQSYVRMYEQWGWVPSFPELTEWGGDWFEGANPDWHGEPMIGNHVASFAAEAIRKGITGFDVEKLYEGLRKNALEGTMIPWRAGAAREPDRFYAEHGYFPALAPGEPEKYPYIDDGWEKRQAVSVTLEHSYDDWCLAQIARYLGRADDYELFMRRSRYYLNLWNPAIGYFAPKNERGEWVEPFDPQLCDGYGARSYFAEVNACVHAFHVQHDIPRLIALMGGDEAFVRRIDEAYNRGPEIDKWKFMGRMPDATGLQGLMPAGNEPAFHVPWLYNYAGAAWKTQHRVRQIADLWFDDRPTGLSGDEDGGALTAWYVFAAMGFYPVNPASGEYALSSPIFERIEIALPGGRSFVVKSPGASKVNKYIRSARLNGEQLVRPFITHEQIVQGGVLEFELTSRPCPDCFRQVSGI